MKLLIKILLKEGNILKKVRTYYQNINRLLLKDALNQWKVVNLILLLLYQKMGIFISLMDLKNVPLIMGYVVNKTFYKKDLN